MAPTCDGSPTREPPPCRRAIRGLPARFASTATATGNSYLGPAAPPLMRRVRSGTTDSHRRSLPRIRAPRPTCTVLSRYGPGASRSTLEGQRAAEIPLDLRRLADVRYAVCQRVRLRRPPREEDGLLWSPEIASRCRGRNRTDLYRLMRPGRAQPSLHEVCGAAGPSPLPLPAVAGRGRTVVVVRSLKQIQRRCGWPRN